MSCEYCVDDIASVAVRADGVHVCEVCGEPLFGGAELEGDDLPVVNTDG